MTSLGVVIATFKREALALDAVASVLAQAAPAVEVLVVDQDTSARLGTALRERFGDDARLRYHCIPTIGLSQARNFGVERCPADVILFLDDDAVALPGWLDGYREAFGSAPAPAMVGGRLLPEYESALPPWFPPARMSLLGLYDIGDQMLPFPGHDLPVGANFGVRRRELLEVGGFDTAMGFNASRRAQIGGEDSLVAQRLKQRGGLLLYQPRAAARHRIRADKVELRPFLRRSFTEGRTQIAITSQATGAGADWFRGVLRWHLRALLRTPGGLLRDLRQGSLTRGQAWAEFAADVAQRLGILAESWSRLRQPREKAEVEHAQGA